VQNHGKIIATAFIDSGLKAGIKADQRSDKKMAYELS